jgi:hypothetical protein
MRGRTRKRRNIALNHRSNTRKLRDLVCSYTSDDYNSNDGMLTSVWGPSMWHVLHTTSFNYPVNPTDEQKLNYRDFILSLKNVLPCGKCRKNLKKNFKKLPLLTHHMENRATFSRYIYDLHEVVNQMLKKKSGLSYEDVRERYEHFRSRCTASLTEHQKRLLEKGCAEPMYGEKSKCVLHIVPQTKKCDTFQVDKQCLRRRGS